MARQFKRTPIKSTRVAYNYRPDTSLRDEERSVYRRIYISMFIILLIAVGLYFWGVEIVAGLGNFWQFVSPGHETSAPASTDGNSDPLIAPRVDPLPLNTKDSKIDIRGWAQSGVEVHINVNGNDAATLLTDKNGRFELSGVELTKGKNEIYAVIKINDNTSPQSETQIVDLDNDAPKLVASLGEPTEDGKIQITGTTDPGINVFVNDHRVILKDEGAFDYTTTLNDGTNIFKIRAEDLAGNITELEEKKDYQKPVPTP